jgi:hypothetical protein
VGDDMQKKMEELKKLTPLTTDQLKMLLPEQLMGMKRSNFNANSMMGFASAEATYKNETDDKEIELNILVVREKQELVFTHLAIGQK